MSTYLCILVIILSYVLIFLSGDRAAFFNVNLSWIIILLFTKKYSFNLGIELMNDTLIADAGNLKICADVNAVPPAGIAGVDAMDNVVAMKNSKSGCFGIGALAIGNIKYKSQHECLKLMCTCDKPVYLHFEHAFEFAQKNV